MSLSPKAQFALEALQRANTVCIDVETSGLDWRRNYIIGYVLCFDPQTSVYVPVRHNGGGNEQGFPGVGEATAGIVPEHPFERLLRPLLAARPRHWIGHNLSFDLGFLHRHDMVLNGTFEDTMINAPLINEHLGSYPLDDCTTRAIAEGADIKAKDQQVLIDHIVSKLGGARHKSRMGDLWKLAGDDPVVVEYAEGDGLSTFGLRDWQQADLDKQDLRYVWKLECDLIPVLNRITTRGIQVSEERLARTIEVMEERVRNAGEALPTGLNVRSHPQIRSLFTQEEIDTAPITEKGNPSFSEKWLEATDMGRHIVAVRKSTNMLSSFLIPLRDKHVFNGRVNPSFSQMRGEFRGTITGRLSSMAPNVQAIHKRNVEMGMFLRRLYVVLFGRRWRSVDYSQIEPRLLAHYSGARVLLDGYRAVPAVDAHSAVAQSAGISRQHGKTINQLLLTGGGVGALAAALDCSRQQAQALFQQYFAKMPEIKTLQRDAAHTFRARGYVRTLMGRRCRIERRDLDYKAVNRLLQGGNADIMKRSLVLLDDLFAGQDEIVMTNTVHDSIDFDMEPTARAEALYAEAMRIMCDYGPGTPFPIEVPIELEAGEGIDWAEATYGAEDVHKFVEEQGL